MMRATWWIAVAMMLAGCIGHDIPVFASNQTDEAVLIEVWVNGTVAWYAYANVPPDRNLELGKIRDIGRGSHEVTIRTPDFQDQQSLHLTSQDLLLQVHVHPHRIEVVLER